jgi:hypothetical protein
MSIARPLLVLFASILTGVAIGAWSHRRAIARRFDVAQGLADARRRSELETQANRAAPILARDIGGPEPFDKSVWTWDADRNGRYIDTPRNLRRAVLLGAGVCGLFPALWLYAMLA